MDKKIIKQKILSFLGDVYQERKSWNSFKGPFDKETERRKELILKSR